MKNLFLGFVFLCVTAISAHSLDRTIVLKEEFIYEKASFPSCHASTILEVQPGVLLAAWFGGSDEGNPDVGIWLSRHEGESWTPPQLMAKEEGVPCWNPVLFKMPDGEIQLYYKAGPNPQEWSGLLMRSTDGGISWSKPRFLPAGILGPIKNKPLLLKDGSLLCGSSVESWRAWACWMEHTPDGGRTWSKYGPIAMPNQPYGIIQPTLFYDQEGNIRMLARARNVGYICTAVSKDEGKTWSEVTATDLPHPNSGIDAVGLKDGRVVLIYNHTKMGRSPINVGISDDGGQTWRRALTLESDSGEYSYPAVIQTEDGLVHITYTWKREKIKHVVVDPAKL